MSNPHRTFLYLLINNASVLSVNNFIWFAVTFWAIIQTNSVVVASFIAGIFSITSMVGSIFFGTLVDHSKKKVAMLYSSLITLTAFSVATLLYFYHDLSKTKSAGDPYLWVFVICLMIGTVAGSIRWIALSTVVNLLFTEGKDKANGMIGAAQGIAFATTSLFSGLVIGFFSMGTALFISIFATLIALAHLVLIRLDEDTPAKHDTNIGRIDLKGTISVIRSIPGLMPLIFYAAFNNLLGGVFMALMDIYGLSLVSVQVWGFLWSAVSVVMILGGLVVAKYGAGSIPLRTILYGNLISWTSCIIFPIQPSIVLLTAGMVLWMFLFSFIEAAEQTLLQTTVPQERQGRVFGFAQSLESAASPITAFIIGPLASITLIPFMTTGAGVGLIGDWFGTGAERGIALVFMAAGLFGAIIALVALHSKSYRQLSSFYVAKVNASTSPPL